MLQCAERESERERGMSWSTCIRTHSILLLSHVHGFGRAGKAKPLPAISDLSHQAFSVFLTLASRAKSRAYFGFMDYQTNSKLIRNALLQTSGDDVVGFYLISNKWRCKKKGWRVTASWNTTCVVVYMKPYGRISRLGLPYIFAPSLHRAFKSDPFSSACWWTAFPKHDATTTML